jgi:hypothetical protein
VLSGAMPKVDERTLTGWAQNDQVFLLALAALAVSGSVLVLALRAMRHAAVTARAARVAPRRAALA